MRGHFSSISSILLGVSMLCLVLVHHACAQCASGQGAVLPPALESSMCKAIYGSPEACNCQELAGESNGQITISLTGDLACEWTIFAPGVQITFLEWPQNKQVQGAVFTCRSGVQNADYEQWCDFDEVIANNYAAIANPAGVTAISSLALTPVKIT